MLVSNTSGTAGGYQLILRINGLEEATKEMTVDAGTSREVSFSVTKNTTGTHQVNLNRLVSSFIVEGKVVNKWWLLAVAAVLAVLLVPAYT